jgi:hypothetical protein
MTALEDLLDTAGAALLAGDLAALSGLDARIMAAAASLPKLDPATARRIRDKAGRNARLLKAAESGLRAARDRVAEIRKGPILATYDMRGHKTALAGAARPLGRF